MVRDAEMYSPWSSPPASVLVPAFAPAVTRIDPGTNVTPVGSTSLRTTAVEVSKPLLMTLIVYSSVSPRRTAPPVWLFRSATVFVVVERSGRTVAIDVTKAPIRTGSWLVFALMVALVSPDMTPVVTLMTSMSTPLMLSASPVSCGRSPAFETAVPRYERVPLKNLLFGLTASVTALPFQSSWLAPVEWPKYATTADLGVEAAGRDLEPGDRHRRGR